MDWQRLVHDRKRAVADGSLLAETRRIVRELPDLLPHGSTAARGRGRRGAGLLPGLPLLPARGPRRTSTRRWRSALQERPDLADVLDDLGPVLADPDRSGGAALPADQRDGDGQGRRGLRVLPAPRGSPRSTRSVPTPASSRSRPTAFHEAMTARQRDWPHAMTALSTHDTKRCEDVRARIAVLAEVPGVWATTLDSAARARADARRRVRPTCSGRRRSAPGRSRATGCTRTPRRRCARPASTPPGPTPTRSTSRRCTPRSTRRTTTDAVRRGCSTTCVARLAPAARSNALAAKLLALTIPGVPDVYQGTELERPQPGRPGQPAAGRLRRGRRPSLADGSDEKQALTARGAAAAPRPPGAVHVATPRSSPRVRAADHVLAFDRGGAVTVVTRLPLGLEAQGRLGRHRGCTCPAGGECVDVHPARARPAELVVVPMSAVGSTSGRRSPAAGAAERRRRGRWR